ncbi:uncharacterized protein FIBRA_04564 [Fibroporia radiculosa]|uniref:Pentacotripeptide-repeat region of PRORP domain-containing protein n=1 Tax=Fibroporia radiculosa TaxID=599839 RepID=J4GPG6_9APHY|nr:uncharacterized protein FIBRA_04564 [Fibroporia radiculosa]CCM02465.1 predicted protein [Fibroporia radiculosa]
MFICRHVSLRAYIPRPGAPSHVPRRLLSHAVSGLQPKHDEFASVPPSPGVQTTGPGAAAACPDVHASSPSESSPSSQTGYQRTPIPFLLNSTPLQAEKKQRLGLQLANNPVATYLEYREKGLSLFREVSVKHLFNILEEATSTRRADVIAKLAHDAVEAGHYLGAPLHRAFIEKLLLCASENRLVAKASIFALLQKLIETGQLTSFTLENRIPIILAALKLPLDSVLDRQLFDVFVSLLLPLLVNPQSMCDYHTLRRSRSAVELLYRLAYELARLDMRAKSFEIMDALVKTDNLSAKSITRSDLQSGDFSFIVLSAITRSCVDWGWRSSASTLIMRALPDAQIITPSLGGLCVYVVRALIENPRVRDVNDSAAIIIQIMQRSPNYDIPAHVLQIFSEAAERMSSPEAIEAVYVVAQSDAVRMHHSYPPPSGHILTSFFHYLAVRSKNHHLARQLASDIVDKHVPIPLQDRGRLIALVASQGFATQARALWERYTTGGQQKVVTSHAQAMLRLVSLFTSLVRRYEGEDAPPSTALAGTSVVEIAEELTSGYDEDGALSDSSHSPGTGTATSALAHSRSGLESVYNEGGPSPSGPGESLNVEAVPRDSSWSSEHGQILAQDPSHDRQLPHENARAAPSASGGALQASNVDSSVSVETALPCSSESPTEGDKALSDDDARVADYRAFALQVYTAFHKSCQPVKEVHHYKLNALARASFMLGKLDEGLEAFRLILSRRIVPDLHDVNVALSILADYNPTAAARVIDRMVKIGLQPDVVTFGIVIHRAVIHNDATLVTALLRRARQLNCHRLDYHTLGALIRATVTMDRDGRASAKDYLDNAKDLVDSLLTARQVPSPNMGRDCVVAALRADDPEMAFRFWRLLMKDKVEWADRAQTKTRKRIASAVRMHCEKGWLNESKGRVMLVELCEPVRRRRGRVLGAVAGEGEGEGEGKAEG